MSNILNSSVAIRLKKVSKRYGRTVALDEVSFEVGEQQMFALLATLQVALILCLVI